MARGNRLGVFFRLQILIGVGVLLLFTGCQKKAVKEIPPIATVEVAEVLVRDVPIHSEWTASTDGFINAAIRAQVQGYLIEQEYKEGDFVRKGQVLFRIDPRTFQATLEQAEGQLTEQKARWENARANLERIRPLVERRAVSQKDLDDAVGLERATHAAVIAAQAVVDKARVDLSFTRITSPIDGIAGIARIQIGNLVGPASPGELTNVSTVDPIKVYVGMSEVEYLRFVSRESGRLQRFPLELVLADGTVHPHPGAFSFAARSVDIKTGTIKMAALFPNPGNVLRPGQFARVRAKMEIKRGALLIPQRAVTELQGQYQVAVITPDKKVAIRSVKVGERVDRFWIIEEGLKAGDTVVVEGLQKIKEGAAVKTTPFKSDSAAPSPVSPTAASGEGPRPESGSADLKKSGRK
jgi:membrane fusion protein, multidrug efflux system